MIEQQLVLFDYATLDIETRVVIQQRTTEIKSLMKRAAQDIMEIGLKLKEIQVILRSGNPENRYVNFDKWIELEFNWSRRTAFNFISVYEKFGGANFAQLEIATSALYLLAAPSTPDFAREEAISRAEAGEQITYSKAKEIVDWNKTQVNKLIEQDREARTRIDNFQVSQQPVIQQFDEWVSNPNPPYELEDEDLPDPTPTPTPLQPQSMNLLTSSLNDAWRTPARYIGAAHQVLNGIDLDPASSAIANETVRAMQYLTKDDDGLKQPWFGTIFCNPPYGKTNNQSNQGLFAHKLIQEYIAGNVIEGIILVNIYSGYGWFAPLRTLPMCLVDHRISFIDPTTDEAGDEAKASSVFIYVGKNPSKFYQVFKQFGPCGQFSYDW